MSARTREGDGHSVSPTAAGGLLANHPFRAELPPRIGRTPSTQSVASVTSARLHPSTSVTTLRRVDTSDKDAGNEPSGSTPWPLSAGSSGGGLLAHGQDLEVSEFEGEGGVPERGAGRGPRSAGAPVSDHEPTATVLSSVTNLCNTILGSGILAMPTAMASVGLLLGSGIILFSGLAAALGLFLLSYATRYVEGRNASFFTVSQLTYPNASLYFDLAIAVKCFGVSISYLIIFGEVMPQVMSALYSAQTQNVISHQEMEALPFYMHVLTDRRFWITLSMTVVAPLSFLRKLDSLRYTSMVALLAIVYLVVIVVVNFFDPDRIPPSPDHVSLIKFSPHFFTNLPIFVFAFTCHQNIFTVCNELRDNSPPKVNKTIHIAISTAISAYLTVGILGYLTFGDDVLPNVILMYKSGPMVTFGQLAIGVLMILSYPLQCHPCRACLHKVIQNHIMPRWSAKAPPADYERLTGGEGSGHEGLGPRMAEPRLHTQGYETLRDIEAEDEDLGIETRRSRYAGASGARVYPRGSVRLPAGQQPMSTMLHIGVTVALLILSYLVAISVSQLDLVLSFVGSTGSTVISFILPGVFYYKLHQRSPWSVLKVAAVALAIYGTLVMVVCLSFNILRLFNVKV
ncbi:hypothetical protein H4R34_001144 [Dimargaris verticillata]|uniref:Amino acid transporter transmembrane domain-containing protein n=1 Tax=Dimargaris verticillata TaxID=2761393 RepID=A0A9W8EES1_9FUNG|nr:hypothetical protein H4R34_001144 [Dimargaris verticillata]